MIRIDFHTASGLELPLDVPDDISLREVKRRLADQYSNLNMDFLNAIIYVNTFKFFDSSNVKDLKLNPSSFVGIRIPNSKRMQGSSFSFPGFKSKSEISNNDISNNQSSDKINNNNSPTSISQDSQSPNTKSPNTKSPNSKSQIDKPIQESPKPKDTPPKNPSQKPKDTPPKNPSQKPPAPLPPEVNQNDVNSIVMMGFSRDQAIKALSVYLDLNLAVNALCSGEFPNISSTYETEKPDKDGLTSRDRSNIQSIVLSTGFDSETVKEVYMNVGRDKKATMDFLCS